MNTTSKVTLGILAGATLGLITGILVAPDSGKKTREKLMGKSKDLKNKMVDSLDEVKKAYNRKIETFATEGKSGLESIKNGLKV
ncbi:MAG: YtxH domain-containing protein [Cyclobacteriaceae bacterium]|jgi:gas vesicle protein|nr:YtxH domain-containing protein [Cyclobacteriaceae bacterium]